MSKNPVTLLPQFVEKSSGAPMAGAFKKSISACKTNFNIRITLTKWKTNFYMRILLDLKMVDAPSTLRIK